MSEDRPATQRIFIFVRNDRVRRDIKSFLENSRRYEVVGEATALDEAVELARATRPDVVLVDIEMVEGDGIQVLRTLRLCLPPTSLVVAIEFDVDEYDAAARAAGAAASISKKRLFDSLLPTLEEARESSRKIAGDGNGKSTGPGAASPREWSSPRASLATAMPAWWKPTGWGEWLTGAATFGGALIEGAPVDNDPPEHCWRYIEAGMAFAALLVLISYLSGGFDRASVFSKGLILATLLALAVAEFRQIRRIGADRPLRLRERPWEMKRQVQLRENAKREGGETR
ncbi:MAG: response regulator [Chloroflexi bacterium]|nr:response regulator [Chloroflexota bacterium]